MPVYEIRTVKSSNGTTQDRIFIKTVLKLFDLEFETEISLTDRKSMKYPMLIGRNFLEDRFIVDVALTHLSTQK